MTSSDGADGDDGERGTEETRSQADVSDTSSVWGSSVFAERLDGFWHLIYQESEPWGDERRWTVFCKEKKEYVDADGEVSRDAYWFPTKEDAADAYDRHLEQTDDVGTLVHLPLTAIYVFFILPVKLIDLLLLRNRGRETGYLAEFFFMGALVLFAFQVSLLFGLLAAVHLGAGLFLMSSPYEPHGTPVRPRWARRNTEINTYEYEPDTEGL